MTEIVTAGGRVAPEARIEATTSVNEVVSIRPQAAYSTNGRAELDALDVLESEAIHIIREVVAEFERPVLLFSGGKDSVVVLHLAAKAFWPGRVPFPVLHVDTGHNFPEVIAFRDATVERLGLRLEVAEVQSYIDDGRLHERADGTRNPLQTQPLLDAIAAGRHDAVFGGARRDEDKARAKERIISLRDEFGQWDPRNQRPELWSLYNGRHTPGQHVRAFPISNWTELDVWSYIERENIPLPELYFAHEREVYRRDGMWRAVGEVSPPRPGETVELRTVRYRTVGDMSCTGAVESDAADVADVVREVAQSTLTERGATRADDRISEAAMEDRKKDGYF
ncbi:sulfate adenylyltransferase subunit CysD [Agromyces sp. ISL-38]|uniref:sulfate adenylyltransferase subunit CysD n=1 Tax=Agromyces sp. ISL-38 TaxID=2819107 RepID=UPI0020365957|nr:sulfate adenylyltransferase subunit CysD [Agromyces sp. ISL-38]